MLPPERLQPGIGWREVFKRRTGMNQAIAFSVLGRLLQGAGSIGTVLMIVHFLSPAEQGFYYALWSVVPLQYIFELGFAFVVLQTAAHEMAHLTILPDQSVVGSARALNRLASILQVSLRWYVLAAGFLLLLMVGGGSHFFAMRQLTAGEALWHWPLRLTAIGCCATFAVSPMLSVLEGCGLVTELSRMRFLQSLFATGLAWMAMLTHHGLYAPAMVMISQAVVACGMLFRKRTLLLFLLRVRGPDGISWKREIWPFQWKIAVSWICDYFIFQLFTPLLFAFRGPAEAGRMGVSMSAVLQLSGLVLTWMTTKAAPFGMLAARRDRKALDKLFFSTLRQSLVLLLVGATLLMAIVLVLPHVLPRIAQRIVPWPIFALLLLTSISTHIVQSEALYVRAHKVEPFLVQSIVIACATVSLMLLVVRPWGTMGVSLVYLGVLGVCGLVSATIIFLAMRRRWEAADVAIGS